MSKSLLSKFIIFIKDIKNSSSLKLSYSGVKNYTYMSLCAYVLILGCHGYYTYNTTQNKIIKVNKKYNFTRNGFTEFMIIDNTGKHYNVNNSVWYWKWDSIEDWNNIETNKEIFIKYYGWRVPLLGLFPNVIMSSQEQVLDLMTSAECRVIDYNYNQAKEIQLTNE